MRAAAPIAPVAELAAKSPEIASAANGAVDTIAIVGAGPVGLTAALMLAAHGLHCVLIEAQSSDAARADRRLLALSRGTLETLRPWLADSVSLAPINDVWVSSSGEFGATHLAAGDFDGAALGATVYYGDLVPALTAAVEAHRQIGWRRPARVAAVEQTPAHVLVRLDGGEPLRVCCVVHAEGRGDGPASPARAAVIADIELAGMRVDAAFERFTRTGPLALLPAPPIGRTSPQSWGLVWCFDEKDSAQRCAGLGDADFVQQLQQQIGTRHADVRRAGPRRVVPLTQRARVNVHAYRQIWLGNAAQTLHPVAGQGFNLGVRDVAVLVECLAAASTADAARPGSLCAAVPGALGRYAARRAGDRAAISAVTRWLPDLFATHFWPIVAARGAVLTALDLAPLLRRQWAYLLMFGVRS